MSSEHNDEHAGKAGTFINDPETGRRVLIEEYQAAQAAKTTAQAALPKAASKKPNEDQI
jgi:hypothetical protein